MGVDCPYLDIEEAHAGARLVDLRRQLLTFLYVVALESREVDDGNIVKVTLDDVLLDVNVAETSLENVGHGCDVDALEL